MRLIFPLIDCAENFCKEVEARLDIVIGTFVLIERNDAALLINCL